MFLEVHRDSKCEDDLCMEIMIDHGMLLASNMSGKCWESPFNWRFIAEKMVYKCWRFSIAMFAYRKVGVYTCAP